MKKIKKHLNVWSALGGVLLSALCVLGVVLFISPNHKALALQDGDYTYTVSGGNATITDYTGAGGALTIPGTLGGYPVISIGANAFQGDTSLISLVIPDSVTSVGTSAFSSCSGLTSITIGSGLTSIGNYGFFTGYSSVMTQFVVSPDNASYSSEDGVLFNKAKTTLVLYPGGKSGAYVVPDSVTSISTNAFYGCSYLTGITLSSNLTTISSGAFWHCNGLTSMTIPASVTSISSQAFYGDGSLTQFIVDPDSSSYSSEGGVLFNKAKTTLISYPPGKSGIYVIPNGVTSIGTYAFYGGTKLTGVSIPSGVTSIGQGAFQGCTTLTGVTIPNSVTSIGAQAFYQCLTLASLTIGSGVTSLGANAFSVNIALTAAYFLGNAPTVVGGTPFANCASGFKIYRLSGKTGWTNPWRTYTTAIFETTAKAITAFTIPSQVGSSTIDEVAHTITAVMPYGTNVTALIPTITTTGVSVSPLSGIAGNFTSSKTYTVTAWDTSTQDYTVTVNFREGFTINIADNLTSESGGTGSFSIVLKSQPTNDVTILLSSDDTSEGTIAVSELVFTSANWGTPQTVVVTGVDDLNSDGSITYNIVTGDVTSLDATYDAFGAGDVADVSMINQDDDPPGVVVAPLDTFATTEAGGTARFSYVLLSQPANNVTFSLSSSDLTEGTVSPVSLTFTNSNWNTPQTVTVTGVDDVIAGGDTAYQLVASNTTSDDAAYNGLTVADPTLTNTDNDTAGITVTTISGSTTEAGGTATFTIVLISEPTADVTIGISSSNTDEGTVSTATLTFTSANWNTPQTVTVTGVDDALADGNVSYTIILGSVSSVDLIYDGLNPDDVNVINIDNENTTPTLSSLAPSGLVDGSESVSLTHEFTFVTTDADDDTAQYRIQVATDSGFSSLVVDYTSALTAAGASSFTVGQTAGTGTYAVGSSGQMLTVSSDSVGTDYYWRVMVTDEHSLASSWSNGWTGDGPSFALQPVLSYSMSGVDRGTTVGGIVTSFTTTASSLGFGSSTVVDYTGATKITTSTNYNSGYQVLISQDHDLTSSDGYTIGGFNNNSGTEPTNTDPQIWVAPNSLNKGFFGYSTTNTNLSGTADRFYSGGVNKYAKLFTSSYQVIRETANTAGSTNYIIFKMQTNSSQEAGSYSNTITTSVVSNY